MAATDYSASADYYVRSNQQRRFRPLLGRRVITPPGHTQIPTPAAGPGEVLLRVRALGINRAETYFRRGLWGDVARVSGIECVGEVEHDPSGRLPRGSKVAAFMGGLGRTRNGSYAELTVAPTTNVVPIQSDLPWEKLAAIPESYSTAWSCLVDHLRVQSGQTFVVRGATSALGQAAVNIASHRGVRVIAATRRQDREDLLRSIGACDVVIEAPALSTRVRELYPAGVDGVLDLLGNSAFRDSLRMVRRYGQVCVAGFLGGQAPVQLDMLNGFAPGAALVFFVSILYGSPEYPLSDIPLQEIVERVGRGEYRARPARVFRFEELPDAHRLMESNEAAGKIVVTLT